MRAVGGERVVMEKRMPLLPMSTIAWRWEGLGGVGVVILVAFGGVNVVACWSSFLVMWSGPRSSVVMSCELGDVLRPFSSRRLGRQGFAITSFPVHGSCQVVMVGRRQSKQEMKMCVEMSEIQRFQFDPARKS